MSEQTKIAWCDSTVNFWSGCTKVSAGCAHCYAETLSNRGMTRKAEHGGSRIIGEWGKGAHRQRHESAIKQAHKLNRKPWICDECGEDYAAEIEGCCCNGQINKLHRRRIFSLSLGDWLDDEVPVEWLAEMLDTIRQCDQVTWILCSKRWENWEKRLREVAFLKIGDNDHPAALFAAHWLNHKCGFKIPANIIGLCSVENQEAADQRIPQFLTVPMACRGLSLEPLLGPVDLAEYTTEAAEVNDRYLDWLIIGGESGPNARPCNVDWIRSLVNQGKAAGVATFVKQLGAYPLHTPDRNTITLHLRDKKGGNPAEWPADLRVQQWPKGF